jgi:hypothetical protein
MKGFFQIGGIAAAITVVGLAFVLIPSGAWDTATLASTLVLASASGIGVAAPQILMGYGTSRTGTLSSFGISGFVIAGFFFLALVSFIQSIIGVDHSYVWATSVAAVGWAAVGFAISRGAISYVDAEFPDVHKVSFPMIAQAELSSIKSERGGQFDAEINQLIDAIRFAASDSDNAAIEEQNQILLLINNELNQAIITNDSEEFGKAFSRIRQLLTRREGKLKDARSRA